MFHRNTTDWFNFIPFHSMVADYRGHSLQSLLNIILFIPYGFLLPNLLGKQKDKKTIIYGLFTSLFIEVFQLSMTLIFRFPEWYCDVDDLILNTIGVLIGILLIITSKFVINTLWKLFKRRKNPHEVVAFFIFSPSLSVTAPFLFVYSILFPVLNWRKSGCLMKNPAEI